jgi:hypothetical protein
VLLRNDHRHFRAELFFSLLSLSFFFFLFWFFSSVCILFFFFFLLDVVILLETGAATAVLLLLSVYYWCACCSSVLHDFLLDSCWSESEVRGFSPAPSEHKGHHYTPLTRLSQLSLYCSFVFGFLFCFFPPVALGLSCVFLLLCVCMYVSCIELVCVCVEEYCLDTAWSAPHSIYSITLDSTPPFSWILFIFSSCLVYVHV